MALPKPAMGRVCRDQREHRAGRVRSTLGSFPDAEKQGVKDAGTPNMGGAIATAGGVVFIGATLDAKFRAFDAKTGKVLWEANVDARPFDPVDLYRWRRTPICRVTGRWWWILCKGQRAIP